MKLMAARPFGRAATFALYGFSAAEDGEKEARGDGGADDARHVGTHCVHEQEVGGIGALALLLGDAGGHRHRGYTGGADERIDLAAGELVHQLAEQDAAYSGELKGKQAEDDDLDGLERKEAGVERRCTDGGGQKDRDDVHQSILRRVGKAVGQAALLEEIAEHEAAEQGSD